MSDDDAPERWLHAGANAPERFAQLVHADDADVPNAAQLARIAQNLASELQQPELADAFRDVTRPTSTRVATDAIDRARMPLSAKLGVAIVTLAIVGLSWFGLRERARPALPSAAPAASTPRSVELAPPDDTTARPPTPTAPVAPALSPLRAASKPRPALRKQLDDPGAELGLLESAQRALPSDPLRALALASEHRARFPHGQFEQEREMLAIEALVALGRKTQALQRAHGFERHHPDSSHLPRLRDLLLSPP